MTSSPRTKKNARIVCDHMEKGETYTAKQLAEKTGMTGYDVGRALYYMEGKYTKKVGKTEGRTVIWELIRRLPGRTET